jgi:CheY-like chemotaxis protein
LGGLIAVVEDETDLQTLYCLVLRSKGHKIAFVADTANGAVEEFQRCPSRPDLVIMDRRLAGSSGEDAARRIASLDPTVRILFATADGDISLLRLPGVIGLLQKPFTIDVFMSAIDRAMSVDLVSKTTEVQKMPYLA